MTSNNLNRLNALILCMEMKLGTVEHLTYKGMYGLKTLDNLEASQKTSLEHIWKSLEEAQRKIEIIAQNLESLSKGVSSQMMEVYVKNNDGKMLENLQKKANSTTSQPTSTSDVSEASKDAGWKTEPIQLTSKRVRFMEPGFGVPLERVNPIMFEPIIRKSTLKTATSGGADTMDKKLL